MSAAYMNRSVMRQREPMGGRSVIATVLARFGGGPAARVRRRTGVGPEPLEARQMLAVTPVTPGTVWATLGSNPAGFTDVNGTVFFAATNSAGIGLFKTDGTAAGTSAVRLFGTNASAGPQTLTASGNTIYFTAD